MSAAGLQGCCALSTSFDPCLLALPSSNTKGTMRVYNAAITGSSVECEVTAHNSPIAVMAWNQDASLLASASSKGTVLRVHKMPQVPCSSGLSPQTSQRLYYMRAPKFSRANQRS